MLHRVLLIAAALAGCGSPSRAGQVDLRSPAELVAERIRTRIEAAGVVMELRAAGEPVYASLVLPSFYERRLYRPAWSDEHGPTRLADDLIGALRRADLEGLRPEDYHLAGIEAVLAAARTDAKRGPALAPDRWAELDLLLTDAFLVYGAHLLAGRVNPETLRPEWVSNRRTADIAAVLETALASGDIPGTLETLVPSRYGYRRLREALAHYREVALSGGWPAIPDGSTLRLGERSSSVAAMRERLRLEDDLGSAETQDAELFDEPVEQAVKKFQRRHGLTADGVVSAATRAELNVPVERRVEQLELNLERWRWLPQDLGRRHIIVNIAAFELEVVEDEAVVMSMRVVVGRPFDRTPVLSDTMRYLVLNPYWHVPSNIATTELLPKLKRDPSYLARYKLRVFPNSRLDAQEVDPATVDWSTISAAHFPFLLRQDPGPRNALGRIKFMFLNKYHVYLHDTPARSLFEEPQRDFSHGCIRIQHPIELAVYLLRNDPQWDRDALLAALDDAEDHSVPLPEPTSIHLLYWTAWADGDGTIQFRRDIHDRDAPLFKALRAPPPRSAPPVLS
ncbi:MAG TPA: L,D-transpeptidase family protein [Gemmatimonadales bacterium]|nr:L,D-transpeptidase family protein [Gemmatimonadales bacterium]